MILFAPYSPVSIHSKPRASGDDPVLDALTPGQEG